MNSSFIEAAWKWAEKGFKIVPLKLSVGPDGGKVVKPLYKWQSETPGFDKLDWTGANAYAIVLGPTKNGWLACVDADLDAPVKTDPFSALVKAFPQLQTTYIEKTPQGFHFFVLIDKSLEAGNINAKTEWGLELHVNGLVIMAPSSYEGGSYSIYNADEIVTFRDFHARFTEKFARQAWFNMAEKPKGYRGADPPCVKTLLQGVQEGLRNEAGIRLASYFLNFKSQPRTSALTQLEGWNTKNKPPLPQAELNNISKSAEAHGYVFGCEDELLSRFCKPHECPFGEVEAEGKGKIVKTASAELPDGRLIEEAYDGKDVYFLVYNPQTSEVQKVGEVEVEGLTYKPIDNPEVHSRLTLLPSEALEYGSEEAFFKEVLDFLNRWHDQPNEFERKLDAFYIFLTYVYDLLPKLPYRRALGAYGRGKTAWLDTVGSICYRPVILAGCDTDKAIIRRINNWRGTALIDEADFDRSSLYAFIVKILNVGYDKRLGFYQRADDLNPKKTVVYDVFGPKLLASREEFRDSALESRCLTFIAQEKTKAMPLFRHEKFLAEAQTLRNKLTMWRFRKYYAFKEKVTTLETTEVDLELTVSSSRVKEVLAPILLLSPQFKPEIQRLAQELEDQLRASDADWQLENEFNQALNQILRGDGREGGDGTIVSPQQEKTLDEYGAKQVVLKVPLVKIAKVILDNPSPEVDELVSLTKRLSKIVHTRLGLKVVRGSKGRRFVEVPGAYYTTVTTLSTVTPVTSKAVRVIELDDKHPLEREEFQPLIQPKVTLEENEHHLKVWNALFEASLTRGSTLVDEIVKTVGLPTEEVKGILEFFQRAGFAVQIRPEVWKIEPPKQIRFGSLRWARVTTKVPNLQVWKATELLHRLHRDMPLDLEFPDKTKVKVRGPLTWFLAKIEALKQFSPPSKTFPLRDSTLPGCVGLGKPIPPNTCETCKQHADFNCKDLKRLSREYFRQFAVEVKRRRVYTDVNLYLCKTPFRLTLNGQDALRLLITRYITNHKANKRIKNQFWAVADDYAAFTILNQHTENIIEEVLAVLDKPQNLLRLYGSSLLQSPLGKAQGAEQKKR